MVGGIFLLIATTWATYNIVRNNVPIPPGMIPGGGGGKGVSLSPFLISFIIDMNHIIWAI